MVEHTLKDVRRDSSTTASEAVAKPAVLPDPAYEFSAPRFYDFATNSQDLPSSERADAWFDTAGTASKRAFGCNTATTVVLELVLTLRHFNAAEWQRHQSLLTWYGQCHHHLQPLKSEFGICKFAVCCRTQTTRRISLRTTQLCRSHRAIL